MGTRRDIGGLSPLGEQLVEARARAIAVLDQDARLGEMQEAAGDLGRVLLAAADDDVLWELLTTSEERRRALTDQQRVRLQAAVDVDWAWLLDSVGYRPPPPSEAQAAELVKAVSEALESQEGAKAEIAREKLRELGKELVELSQTADVPNPHVRRWLRRGVRVAGRVVIVAGVAAAGVALLHTAPFVALGPVFSVAAVDVLKDGAVRTLDWVLDRTASEEGSARRREEDPADRAAFGAISAIDNAEFGRLKAVWEILQALEVEGAAGPGHPVEETLAQTGQLLANTLQALYRLWDAAVGASWNSPSLQMQCGKLSAALNHARLALHDADNADPRSVLSALQIASDALIEIQVALGQAIGHA